ncbi:MAG: hypothetical protein JWO41_426 [Candidatus Saccharibacteria bacterium]|nr:hypothetical protein [Candidatus Saccharibacteria bacterium]
MSRNHEQAPSLAKRTSRKVAAAGVAGAVLVGAGYVAYNHDWLHMPGFGTPDRKNQIDAKVTKLDPIALACRTYMEAEVKGYLHSKLLNTPGTGYVSDLHGKKGDFGKTESLGCMPDPDVVITTAKDGKHQQVAVNLAKFSLFTRIDESVTRITNPHPAISSMGEGLSGFAGGISKALTGGSVNADIFEGTVSGHEADLNAINAQLVVNKVDTECATTVTDQIKAVITRSYVQEEASKFHLSETDAAGYVAVSFVDTPNFTATYDPFSDYSNTWYKLDQQDIRQPKCTVAESVMNDPGISAYQPGAAVPHNLLGKD